LVTEFTALFALDPGPLPEAVSEQPPPGGLPLFRGSGETSLASRRLRHLVPWFRVRFRHEGRASVPADAALLSG